MAQHSHPPRRVAQSPKQNTFFGGAAVLSDPGSWWSD